MMRQTKLFVFRSIEHFEEYRDLDHWCRRCSMFMSPTEPFLMDWDGFDYTRLPPSLDLENEFLMGEVYAFMSVDEMDKYVIPHGCVSQENKNVDLTEIEVLTQKVDHLNMELTKVRETLDKILFKVTHK